MKNYKLQVEIKIVPCDEPIMNEPQALSLLNYLWHGLIEPATDYLKTIEDVYIKNRDALLKLRGYFERNRPFIPCYSVRKRLGLRNSSNVGEKSNDLLVSDRQKHNGMSWSPQGRVSLLGGDYSFGTQSRVLSLVY